MTISFTCAPTSFHWLAMALMSLRSSTLLARSSVSKRSPELAFTRVPSPPRVQPACDSRLDAWAGSNGYWGIEASSAGRSAELGATKLSAMGAIPYAKDARVRMLGSTGKQRSKFLPELPSVDESGLPGYAFDSWIGLLGPAGTPRGTVRAINAAVAKLLQDPVILERLDKQGVVPQAMTPEAFGELLRADYAKMAKVVKISGARID